MLTRAAALVAVGLSIGAPAAATGPRLKLSSWPVPCVDNASGWYVARVAPGRDSAHFRLRVLHVIKGPSLRWIPMNIDFSSARWRQLRGLRVGRRAVVRTPVRLWRAGGFPGCTSLFFEGAWHADSLTLPVLPAFWRNRDRSAVADDFQRHLAYLTAHFDALADPTERWLARDLRSGDRAMALAAVDVIARLGSSDDPRLWDELGPALADVVGDPPEHVDSARWGDVIGVLTQALLASIEARQRAHQGPAGWWKNAERLLASHVRRRVGMGLQAPRQVAALRAAGFDLDAEHPTAAQIATMERKLGMPQHPGPVKGGSAPKSVPSPRHLPRPSHGR